MNEKGPPEFSYEKHKTLAAEELKTIESKRKRDSNQVVTLTHTDGTQATVNADTTDEAYIAFTAKGFKCADEDKHLVKSPVSATPEAERIAVLEAKINALTAGTRAVPEAPVKRTAEEVRAELASLEADEKASKQKPAHK